MISDLRKLLLDYSRKLLQLDLLRARKLELPLPGDQAYAEFASDLRSYAFEPEFDLDSDQKLTSHTDIARDPSDKTSHGAAQCRVELAQYEAQRRRIR